jgi:hypothetical protein
MKDSQVSQRLEVRWVPVVDASGRTRLEGRWVPAGSRITATHAA